jgi:hypothetical protein
MIHDILTIKVPIPVPEIKTYSRWQVFLALFDRRSHFTTCDTLLHQLALETELTTQHMLDKWRTRDDYPTLRPVVKEER